MTAQTVRVPRSQSVARARGGSVNPTYITLGLFVILCAVATATTPLFLTSENVLNVLRQSSVVAIVAVVGTAVMVSGGLDISVGGVLALSSVTVATLGVAGLPMPVALAGGIAVGGAVGLVNATLAVRFGVNWIIVTLGTLYIARGLAFLLAGGQAVVVGIPPWFQFAGRSYVGPVPTPVVIAFVVIVAMAIVMRYTVLGHNIYAIGGNRQAAVLSGIRVGRIQAGLYVASGMSAGLGGIILASRLGSGQPESGIGLEFDVIVAIILGGTSLHGGIGSVQGTVLGVLIVSVLGNLLNLHGIQAFYQLVAQGLVLIGAVLLDADIRKQGITTRLRFPSLRRGTGSPAAG